MAEGALPNPYESAPKPAPMPKNPYASAPQNAGTDPYDSAPTPDLALKPTPPLKDINPNSPSTFPWDFPGQVSGGQMMREKNIIMDRARNFAAASAYPDLLAQISHKPPPAPNVLWIADQEQRPQSAIFAIAKHAIQGDVKNLGDVLNYGWQGLSFKDRTHAVNVLEALNPQIQMSIYKGIGGAFNFLFPNKDVMQTSQVNQGVDPNLVKHSLGLAMDIGLDPVIMAGPMIRGVGKGLDLLGMGATKAIEATEVGAKISEGTQRVAERVKSPFAWFYEQTIKHGTGNEIMDNMWNRAQGNMAWQKYNIVDEQGIPLLKQLQALPEENQKIATVLGGEEHDLEAVRTMIHQAQDPASDKKIINELLKHELTSKGEIAGGQIEGQRFLVQNPATISKLIESSTPELVDQTIDAAKNIRAFNDNATLAQQLSGKNLRLLTDQAQETQNKITKAMAHHVISILGEQLKASGGPEAAIKTLRKEMKEAYPSLVEKIVKGAADQKTELAALRSDIVAGVPGSLEKAITAAQKSYPAIYNEMVSKWMDELPSIVAATSKGQDATLSAADHFAHEFMLGSLETVADNKAFAKFATKHADLIQAQLETPLWMHHAMDQKALDYAWRNRAVAQYLNDNITNPSVRSNLHRFFEQNKRPLSTDDVNLIVKNNEWAKLAEGPPVGGRTMNEIEAAEEALHPSTLHKPQNLIDVAKNMPREITDVLKSDPDRLIPIMAGQTAKATSMTDYLREGVNTFGYMHPDDQQKLIKMLEEPTAEQRASDIIMQNTMSPEAYAARRSVLEDMAKMKTLPEGSYTPLSKTPLFRKLGELPNTEGMTKAIPEYANVYMHEQTAQQFTRTVNQGWLLNPTNNRFWKAYDTFRYLFMRNTLTGFIPYHVRNIPQVFDWMNRGLGLFDDPKYVSAVLRDQLMAHKLQLGVMTKNHDLIDSVSFLIRTPEGKEVEVAGRDALRYAMQHNITDSSFFTNELDKNGKLILNKPWKRWQTFTPFHPENLPNRLGADAQNLYENAPRMGAFFSLQRMGYDAETAAKRVLWAAGDFRPQAYTKFEREIATRAAFFYKWSRYNSPMQVQLLLGAQGPGGRMGIFKDIPMSTLKTAAVPKALQALTPVGQQGIDQTTVPVEAGDFERQMGGVRFRYNPQTGNPEWFAMNGWSSLGDLDNFLAAGQFMKFAIGQNPIAAKVIESMMGKSLTGMDLKAPYIYMGRVWGPHEGPIFSAYNLNLIKGLRIVPYARNMFEGPTSVSEKFWNALGGPKIYEANPRLDWDTYQENRNETIAKTIGLHRKLQQK